MDQPRPGHVIDGADHIFSPVRSQAALAELLTRYLRAHFAPGEY